MSLEDATRQRIEQLISSHDVLLFMKGSPDAPQCGFSATVIQILDSYIDDYGSVDVLSDPEIREGIKAFSSWPTIPQLYVRGEFIGGCDIIKELNAGGELFETFGVEPPAKVVPKIEISDEAAAALRQAQEQHGGPDQYLHLSVSRSFESALSMGPEAPLDVAVESNGVRLLLDRMSATRAEGIRIEVVETPRGPAFKVENPNAPQVQAMSVQELAAALSDGAPLELLDVRSVPEREAASIEGSVLLTEQEGARIQALPKDTRLVFICHHGGRSQQAAEHFVRLGFTDVWNVIGGIDAWSTEIDPSVPRY